MKCNLVLSLLFVFIITGCSSKENFIILSPSKDGKVGALKIETGKGSTVIEEEGKAVYFDGASANPTAEEPVTLQTSSLFTPALDVHPLMPQSFLLYFQSNSFEITDESKQVVPDIKDAIAERNSDDVSVIGHTDRTGKDS